MPVPKAVTQEELLRLFANAEGRWLSVRDLTPELEASRRTLHRRLTEAVAAGRLEQRGLGAGREYRLAGITARANLGLPSLKLEARGTGGPQWSARSMELRRYIGQPRALRTR